MLIFKVPLHQSTMQGLQLVRSLIRSVPSRFMPGVVLHDLNMIVCNPVANAVVVQCMVERLQHLPKIDAIAGVESLGLVFGTQVAYRLGVKFVPVKARMGYSSPSEPENCILYTVQPETVRPSEHIVVLSGLLQNRHQVNSVADILQAAGAHAVQFAAVAIVHDFVFAHVKEPCFGLITL